MHDWKRVSSSRTVGVVLGICAMLICCAGAFAQEGRPGPTPPDPQKMAKVWEAEAKTVAQSLTLSADLTTKLVDAYKAAREGQMTAMRAAREQGAPRDPAKMMEATKAEKAKFETTLKGFLNAEQATSALASLGTFSRQWDSMAGILDGLGLDAKSKAGADKLVLDFIVASGKIREAAPGSDFVALREKLQPLRETLDADLAKVLSAEQITKWKQATTRRGPRGGEGPRGGGAAGQPAPTAPAPAAPAPTTDTK
jgi:hypothetical protein